ncbi:hypothetical protein [Campylobacter sp. VTCC 70190]|uniref:hypothetical protein n=1 Tax=Campylobacter sp. VTCC 70190 TaxID=3392118 RepID=UPI00398EE5CA
MAITLAVEKGNWVEVYDGNKKLCSLRFDKGDKLLGFTSSSVSIKHGYWVDTYDEKGKRISRNPA